MKIIIERFRYFFRIILKLFVRANHNYKNNEFNSLYEFNPVIFFNDTVSNEINIDGVYEKNQLDTIKPYLNKDTFLDIGANIGNHTLYFHKFFKNIFSFEPHPLTYKLLEINTKYKSNIKVFNFGLSDKKKNTKVVIRSVNNISGETFQEYDAKGKIIEDVYFKKFDELYNFNNQLSLIKVDVEGNELDVLRSMKKNLLNNQAIIFLEFDMKDFNQNNEIITLLKSVGYNYFYFFEVTQALNLRFRNLLSIFFKIIFFGHKEKIKLTEVGKFNKNKDYLINIIVSKHKLNKVNK